jgi:hypothetical protein
VGYLGEALAPPDEAARPAEQLETALRRFLSIVEDSEPGDPRFDTSADWLDGEFQTRGWYWLSQRLQLARERATRTPLITGPGGERIPITANGESAAYPEPLEHWRRKVRTVAQEALDMLEDAAAFPAATNEAPPDTPLPAAAVILYASTRRLMVDGKRFDLSAKQARWDDLLDLARRRQKSRPADHWRTFKKNHRDKLFAMLDDLEDGLGDRLLEPTRGKFLRIRFRTAPEIS